MLEFERVDRSRKPILQEKQLMEYLLNKNNIDYAFVREKQWEIEERYQRGMTYWYLKIMERQWEEDFKLARYDLYYMDQDESDVLVSVMLLPERKPLGFQLIKINETPIIHYPELTEIILKEQLTFK